MPLHKVTCVPRGHALGIVRHSFATVCVYGTYAVLLQTSQLPEGDMFSISQSEYKAMIDVCMGGRVAETLSEFVFVRRASPLTAVGYQFMVRVVSRADARLTFKRRPTPRRKWSRWGLLAHVMVADVTRISYRTLVSLTEWDLSFTVTKTDPLARKRASESTRKF